MLTPEGCGWASAARERAHATSRPNWSSWKPMAAGSGWPYREPNAQAGQSQRHHLMCVPRGAYVKERQEKPKKQERQEKSEKQERQATRRQPRQEEGWRWAGGQTPCRYAKECSERRGSSGGEAGQRARNAFAEKRARSPRGGWPHMGAAAATAISSVREYKRAGREDAHSQQEGSLAVDAWWVGPVGGTVRGRTQVHRQPKSASPPVAAPSQLQPSHAASSPNRPAHSPPHTQ